MQPEVDILGISLKTFGVTFALAFLACGLLLARRLRELELPVDWAYEIIFAALLGGSSARASTSSSRTTPPSSTISLARSSRAPASSGTAARSAARSACIAWMRWRRVLQAAHFDMCATGARARLRARAHRLPGLRRRGLRHPLESPWAMGYPTAPSPRRPGSPCSPRPSTRPLAMGLVAYFLWQLRDRVRPGVIFALYLVAQRPRALPRGVRPPQQRGARRAHRAAAREPRALALDRARVARLAGSAPRGACGVCARALGAASPDDRLSAPRDNPRPRWLPATRHQPLARLSARSPPQRARRRWRWVAATRCSSRASSAPPPTWSPRKTCAPARGPSLLPAAPAGTRISPSSMPRRPSASPLCCALFAQEGLWCDVASGGELHLALAAGFPPSASSCTATPSPKPSCAPPCSHRLGLIVIDNFDEIERLQRLLARGARAPMAAPTAGAPASHARCARRHPREDLHRPGRLEVRLRHGRTRARPSSACAPSPGLELRASTRTSARSCSSLSPSSAPPAARHARPVPRLGPRRRARRRLHRRSASPRDRGLRRRCGRRRAHATSARTRGS